MGLRDLEQRTNSQEHVVDRLLTGAVACSAGRWVVVLLAGWWQEFVVVEHLVELA